MPLEVATGQQAGLRPHALWESDEAERRRKLREQEREDDAPELTPEEQARYEVVTYCNDLYEDARRVREPFETFDKCWGLFTADVWPRGWSTWRAKITINKIRAFITFMQAIMTDNKPRIGVEPSMPGTEYASELLRKLVDRIWDNNDMQQKLSTMDLYGLIWGTGFMKVAYDPYADGGRGKYLTIPVVPYRVFTNRTATCIEDCEYLIHVEDMTMGWVRRNFPDKADVVYGYRGQQSSVGGSRERDRDYIREGDQNEQMRIVSAQNINGNITAPQIATLGPDYAHMDRDTVEIMEVWMRDDSLEQYQRQKIVGGVAQTEPEVGKDGAYVLETVGQRVVTSEIDGQPSVIPIRKPKMKPVMETAWRQKFPNGRLCIIAAGRILLRDIPNPFQIDGFPWAMWKDYDVGAFWGQGETLALGDMAIATNRIATMVYNILEKLGNPSYKFEKGKGVNVTALKNRAGVLIGMDDVKALEPLGAPQIPKEFFELFDLIQKSMGVVSGINDSIQGNMPASNTAFATVDQLTEAGSAPIRLKVRNFETGITRIGKLLVQLIQQFDQGQRPIRWSPEGLAPIEEDAAEGEDASAPQPASAVQADFRNYRNSDLQGQVEFKVTPISSLSVSPAATWNKWLEMYKAHLIDRRWWHEKQRVEGWRTELPRVEEQEKADAAAQAAAKDKSRPGPPPKTTPSKGRRGKPAPPSNIPSAQQRAAVR